MRTTMKVLAIILLLGVALFCGYGFLASYELGFPNIGHVLYSGIGAAAVIAGIWLIASLTNSKMDGRTNDSSRGPGPRLALGTSLRWTARVLTVLLVGMVLVFFVADVASGGTNLGKLNTWDVFALAWLFMTCVGMVIAWRWPVVGGAVAGGGILVYYAVDLLLRGRFLNNFYFDLMLLTGILFVISGLTRRRAVVATS